MAFLSKPAIVVEDDPFLRLIQVVLDPTTPSARVAAFSHFFAHDFPDFARWCERVRDSIGALYPAHVRLVKDMTSLYASLAGAQIVVVESCSIGDKEIA